MSDQSINQEQFIQAIHCGIPFAAWTEPESKTIKSIFCKPEELLRFYSLNQLDTAKGFVFAPFQVCKHLPVYVLPFETEFRFNIEAIKCPEPRKAIIGDQSKFSSSIEEAKIHHIRQVSDFILKFSESGIKKAVLSRNKWLPKYRIDQMPDLFNKLNETYPNAFVYQVFIPEAGYWVGASPELLFSTENGTATTVSLAGTQLYKGHEELTEWDHKELIEQELVTEHIRKVLTDFGLSDYKESGPETAKAGGVVHLKTLLEFPKEKIKNHIGTFLESLHPTPAVCGLPVKDSLELILKTESYDREYYTGFLGPLNPTKKIALFVNLRCLQAFDNGVVLYAGGGITPESDPEKEWEETRMKIQTLERILEDFQG